MRVHQERTLEHDHVCAATSSVLADKTREKNRDQMLQTSNLQQPLNSRLTHRSTNRARCRNGKEPRVIVCLISHTDLPSHYI